jgi:hypothetical protein
VYYRLPGPEGSPLASEAIDWVRKSLAATAGAADDRRRLKQILKVNPSVLCRRQCQR